MYEFQNIIGNDNIITNLQNSILFNHVSHFYIFSGLNGLGKMLMANTFAKTLLCELGTENSCGKCSSCLSFDSNNNPDIIRVSPTKNKSIGVDDIREQINKEVSTKPYKFRYKIFILEDCENLTLQAQNALLKTLENPNQYNKFIMTVTNTKILLPTVISRCIVVKFTPLPLPHVKNYIKSNFTSLSEETAYFISTYSNGSIGKAIESIEDENFNIIRTATINILDDIQNKDFIEIFNMAKELDPFKERIEDVLNIALLWYRDIVIMKELEDTTKVLQQDLVPLITKNAAHLELDNIYNNIEAIWKTRNNLRFNSNFQLSIEVLLMKLICLERFTYV